MSRIIAPPQILGVKSRQDFTLNMTGLVNTANLAVTSVDMNNSILLTADGYMNSGDATNDYRCFALDLSSATNIRMQKNTAFTVNNPNIRATQSGQLIEFNAGVLKRNVQRGFWAVAATGALSYSSGSILTAPTNRQKVVFSYLGMYTNDNIGSVNPACKMNVSIRLNVAGDGFELDLAGNANTKTYNFSYEVAEFV